MATPTKTIILSVTNYKYWILSILVFLGSCSSMKIHFKCLWKVYTSFISSTVGIIVGTVCLFIGWERGNNGLGFWSLEQSFCWNCEIVWDFSRATKHLWHCIKRSSRLALFRSSRVSGHLGSSTIYVSKNISSPGTCGLKELSALTEGARLSG